MNNAITDKKLRAHTLRMQVFAAIKLCKHSNRNIIFTNHAMEHCLQATEHPDFNTCELDRTCTIECMRDNISKCTGILLIIKCFLFLCDCLESNELINSDNLIETCEQLATNKNIVLLRQLKVQFETKYHELLNQSTDDQTADNTGFGISIVWQYWQAPLSLSAQLKQIHSKLTEIIKQLESTLSINDAIINGINDSKEPPAI